MKFLLVVLFAAAASALAPLHVKKDKIEGSYIVSFKDNVDVATGLKTIKELPFFSTLGGRIDREYFHAIKGFAATLSEKALGLIRNLDIVEFVEEDQMMYASKDSSGVWGLDRVDQRTNTRDGTYTCPHGYGGGVTVYVLDTGINDHEDIAGRVTDRVDFHSKPNGGYDCNGHGTHCAGTVGGYKCGTADSVELVAVRVLGCFGSGANSGVIAGMDYVASLNGKRVASMSLGGGYSLMSNNAANRMFSAGAAVIVAAGNSNEDAANSSPASAEDAFTVGATDDNDNIASFSNYGSCVNIFAPGVNIQSCDSSSYSGFKALSGTSMACPHVAGSAAIAYQYYNNPREVYDALTRFATKNVISGLNFAKSSSPNSLLYVGDIA